MARTASFRVRRAAAAERPRTVSLRLTPDAWRLTHCRMVCAGGHDNKINVWGVESMNCIATLTGHSNNIRGLLEVDGKLVSTAADNKMCVWDLAGAAGTQSTPLLALQLPNNCAWLCKLAAPPAAVTASPAACLALARWPSADALKCSLSRRPRRRWCWLASSWRLSCRGRSCSARPARACARESGLACAFRWPKEAAPST